VGAARCAAVSMPRASGRLKRIFFKNALYDDVTLRE
jgi:hypothetical protein